MRRGKRGIEADELIPIPSRANASIILDMTGWLTPDEAAAYLKVTRSTIYRWSEEERLPFYELESGGGRRYHLADLDRLLKRDNDPRTRHLLLAAAFRRIHDELDAMSLDLITAQCDFGPGWDALVKNPAFWTEMKHVAVRQSEAHRDVAPSVMGRTMAQQLFDAAVELAQRNGHRPEGAAMTATDAHASCALCGGEITIGHPPSGGMPQVIVNSLAAACPPAARLADDQAQIPTIFPTAAPINHAPAGFYLPQDPRERISRAQLAPDQVVADARNDRLKRRR